MLPTLDIMASLGNARQRLIAGIHLCDGYWCRYLRACCDMVCVIITWCVEVCVTSWRSVWPGGPPDCSENDLSISGACCGSFYEGPVYGLSPFIAVVSPPETTSYCDAAFIYNSLGTTLFEYWGQGPISWLLLSQGDRLWWRTGRPWRAYQRTWWQVTHVSNVPVIGCVAILTYTHIYLYIFIHKHMMTCIYTYTDIFVTVGVGPILLSLVMVSTEG